MIEVWKKTLTRKNSDKKTPPLGHIIQVCKLDNGKVSQDERHSII